MRVRQASALLGLAVWLYSWSSPAQIYNITLLHTPSAQTVEGRDLKISGNIIGADQVSIAALVYRLSGKEEFEVRELKLVSGDMYEGVIPGKDVKPPAIEYYCYAVDFEGNRHIVFASEQGPQRVPVVAQAVSEQDRKPDQTPREKPEPGPGDRPVPPPGPVGYPDAVLELATRSRQTVGRAPAIASVVVRRQIEAMGARTVADVLDQLPGISIARSVTGDFRIALRGVQSDPEILVLLDGHRINDPYSGAALLEFPAEAVERVEFIRGPGSALYGTGAFMGVIDIITRKGTGLHVDAAYGLFNEVRISAGGGWSEGDFEIGGQVQFMRTGGQDRKVEQDVLTGVEGTTRTSSDDMSNTPGPVDDGRLQLHAQFQSVLKDLGGGELTLLGHYFFQTRGAFVGKFNSLDSGSDLSLHLVNLDLGYRVPLGQMVRLDSRVYFDTHVVERAFMVIRAPDSDVSNAYEAGYVVLSEGLREIDSYQSLTAGAEVTSTIELLENNSLAAGVQLEYLGLAEFTQERDAGDLNNIPPCDASEEGCLSIKGHELPCGSHEGAPSGKDRIVFGFFAQDQWNDILPGLDLLAGFRLEYFTDFGLAFNPRVAVVYGPIEQLRIKALYAQAFRAPTFRELYDDAQFDPIRSIQGEPDLKPVKINTLELGLEGHLETGPVDFRLRGNLFFNWIDDSIESADKGYGLAWDNVESMNVFGTEVEGIARFGKRNRLFVNSSWYRAEVEVAGQPESSYITDVPQMRLNLGMDLAVADFLNLHLGLRYGSERRNNVRQRLELLRSFRIPAYTLVRFGLSTEPILLDHLVFYAHFYNVFDHDMRDPPPRPDHLPGYLPRAPFTFLMGVAWRP